MATTIPSFDTAAISLREYLSLISKSVDLRDRDQVLESARYLKQLANNKQFLIEKFNHELLHWNDFQPANAYSSQTLTLGGGDGFLVRANMWAPLSEDDSLWELESKLFTYSQPHDHNFSFLTVGYWGSGYNTSIYECDPNDMIGYQGEEIDLQFLETTSLPEGKLMYYRASRDIHSQEPPEEFSISINLLLLSPEISLNNQHWFDLEHHSITGYVQQIPSAGRMMLCNTAKYIGNSTTANILEQLSKKHIFPRLRAAAFESLAHLEPNSAPEVWNTALNDKSNYVKHHAEKAISKLST